jgi:hypothetical protein
MRRVVKVCLVMAAVALIWAPTQARADGYVSPWIAANTGAGFDLDLIDTDNNGRASFGFQAGYMGGGYLGGEVDFGWSPSFFGDTDVFSTNKLFSFMGNVIVGYPAGGTSGGSVRPYGTVGIGLIHTSVDAGFLFPFDSSNNSWGWNAGFGVMGFFNDHFGLRGDVRYMRTFNNEIDVADLEFNPGNFHFWRAAAGVVIR